MMTRKEQGATPHRMSRLLGEESGAAAVEFAIWLTVLAYPLLNVVDLGLFVYKSMEVSNAAQMAVQAAFNACGQVYATPIVTTCGATLTNARDGGAHSTSLGSSVSVTDTSECVSGTVKSGSQTACPSSNGDYLGVSVSYTYTPVFGRASITSLLGPTVARTDWIRMS